ncbi:gag-pol polyprotein [Tanacetum coccineum]
MFALTVSRTEPKNIKEAMDDSTWIEAMQEELYHFDRLDVWELVDRPPCKNLINMKWLWKNKRGEENTLICNKAHRVAKGYGKRKELIPKSHLHPLLCWKLSSYSLRTNVDVATLIPAKSDSLLHTHTQALNVKHSTSRLGIGYDNQRTVNVVGAKETVGTKGMLETQTGKGCNLSQGEMLLCKQEETGIQLCAQQVDWRDDTDDEPDDEELEAHYLYMAQIQEVTLDAAHNSRPIFDAEPLQKVQHDDDNYNVFAYEREHPEQPEYVNDTYPDEHNIIIDSLDMSHDREHDDQDDNDDLAKECDFLASLLEISKF